MKKRIMIMISIVFIIGICVIGTTLAKYKNQVSSSESARIAKWGINIETSGEIFSNTYKNSSNDSIVVSSSTKVVAPGTSKKPALTFKITGSAEVSSKVTLSLENSSIFLKAGTYENLVTSKSTDEFTLTKDYYPIKYKLSKNGDEVVEGKIDDIVSFVNQENSYAPNTNINDIYVLSWEWDIDGNDEADTYLGKISAGLYTSKDSTTYNITESIKLAITVQQVN